MQSIASLDLVRARALLECLGKESIAGELRTTTNESGVEMSEIFVADGQYELACDVAEAWFAEWSTKDLKKHGRCCPKCRSSKLQCVPHDELDYIWKCQECGCEIVFKDELR
jgi:hypothetical protein